MTTLTGQSCRALVAQDLVVNLICVHICLSFVTAVASGCDSVASLRTERRLGSPPRE
jgi:hypothetical protein